MEKINILETTLRDGSYALNFSFSAADTAIICSELEKAGFEYIEIGHGVGLNASAMGYGVAIQTDEEYMIAAEKSLSSAKYGMFCIPGIARLQDIEMAASHKMGFVRIGTNVTEVKNSKKFIKKAKSNGMMVMANYMKSYALSPVEFAEQVRFSESYGADVIYIVDSAGGMFPDDIRRYFDAIRKVSQIPIGFHGHDNLGLAIANNLEVIKVGAAFVDSSLQGLGRSSGNAASEILVAAVIKLGYELEIDFLKVLDIGQKYILPLLNSKGRNSLDIVSGFSDFHSSYMHHIHKYASKYSVNPAILIMELCKVDKVNLNETLLNEIALRIQSEKDLYLGKYNFSKYIGAEQDERK